jgi:hypothetical protein
MSIEQIEESILRLSTTDQLHLIERVIHRIREQAQPSWEEELIAMANDPAIQRELRLIESDLSDAEADGLENE